MKVEELKNKIVKFVSAWGTKRGVKFDEQSVFNHIVEEVGELAREYVNKFERKDKFNEEEFNNAILDSIMQLVYLAHLRNLDLEKSILKVIADEQKRLS